MISEEEFVLKARQEWQLLRELESQSEDFYTFEKDFEHRWMYFGVDFSIALASKHTKATIRLLADFWDTFFITTSDKCLLVKVE